LKFLRTTALVDAPLRIVSATLTERALFSGDGPLAPGDELRLSAGRVRVAEVGLAGLRLVPVGGMGAIEFGVRLVATGAGVLVTVTAQSPGPWVGMVFRRRLLGLLGSTVDRIRERAAALRGASVVVGAAIVRGNTVLAQQRAYPPAAAGKWELPGGRVEAGESDVDAVRRECAEELGVDVRVGTAVGPDVVLENGALLRIHVAELVDGEAVPQPHDHQAVRWLSPGRLGSVEWLPADRVLLPALRRLLTDAG
jgi:8-oxo-dGTP diphosphatase